MKKRTHIITLLFLTLPAITIAETVTSNNFVLQDASGHMGGQLTYSGEGTPTLFLYDKHNVPRVSIGLYPDGAPGVVLNDDKGLAGAIMRLVTSNGDPVVVLKENGQDKVIVDTKGRASPLSGTSGAGGGMSILSLLLSAIVGAIAGAAGAKAVPTGTRQPNPLA